ncbi:MAG: hypothetical protein ACR2QO_00095 [Acidimicrobiales bacterium]
MFESLILPTLLVVANVAGAGMVLPQVLRLKRTGVAAGVSAVGAGVGIAMNLWWLAYGIAQGLWGLLPVAGGAFALYLTMAVLLVRIAGRHAVGGIAQGHLMGLIPLAGLIGWGWGAAGLTIGLLYGAQFLPALMTALRSPSLAGVSRSMWLLAWIEAAIWLVYGLQQNDVALTLGGGGGSVVATLILACLATRAAPRVAVPAQPDTGAVPASA